MNTETVLIGLRCNLMEGLDPLRKAVQEVQHNSSDHKISNIYKSEGLALERGWLAELWAVLRLRSNSDLHDLKTQMLFWSDRTPIELTLLSFGSHVVLNPEVPLPHPHLHRMRIFLQCAAEVEPHFIHPILGQTLLDLVNSDARVLNGEFFAQGRQTLKV